MDVLGGLEEISEQTSTHINPGARRPKGGSKWGRGISSTLTHAKVSREKLKTKAKRDPRPPCESPAPAAVPVRAKLGRPFNEYRTLIETCRERADELDLSRAELDRLALLPQGYSGKVLGKVENCQDAKNKKRIWPIGLEAMLGALGLKIVVIVDEDATSRTLRQRVPVDRAQQRFGNVSRIAARGPREKR